MAVYLKYVMKNIEPIRIADDSTSQSGQTMTLRYIPGSTIRGIIVNRLAGDADFEKIKKQLFSGKVKYLNAYPSVMQNGVRYELFPSPKGFYEDKTGQTMKNVVISGEFDDGMKRAKIGRFVRFEDHKICYYNVKTSSDMKILSNVLQQKDRNVFRNEFISAGTEFTGYILVEDVALRERMANILQGTLLVGNARSAGFGKCIVNHETCERLPFWQIRETTDLSVECYMMLLSNTVMRNENGELCGLNLKALGKKMGVSGLDIEFCTTSTVNVKGYNRTWGSKIPSAVMYEAGSVFHFKYRGTLKAENMKKLSEEGIGIRTNEGFGQVIFLKDYTSINGKREIEAETVKPDQVKVFSLSEDERNTLKIIAKAYYHRQIETAMQKYILENPLQKGSESSSRLGILESFTTAYQYDPAMARRIIEDYYAHAEKKEKNQSVHQERASMRVMKAHVLKILDKNSKLEDFLSVETRDADCVMGIPKSELLPETEQERLKLKFLTKEIRFNNKKGVQ